MCNSIDDDCHSGEGDTCYTENKAKPSVKTCYTEKRPNTSVKTIFRDLFPAQAQAGGKHGYQMIHSVRNILFVLYEYMYW